MKKFLFLFAVLLGFACSYVQANNKRNADDIAKKVASRIIAQLNYNKSQKDARRKSHIINLNNLNPSLTSFYSHLVNNGAFFWNLTVEEQNEINDHVSSYTAFNDIEYIIVIGSIFKYDDLESDIPDKDWASLLKKKVTVNTGVDDSQEEHEFFRKVKKKVEQILNVQPAPLYPKFIINWYMSTFSEDGDGENKKLKVETKTFVTNRSGFGSSGFGFEALDGQLTALGVTLSKKEWIKKNVDFDAKTLSYIKDLETNIFFVNKSSRQVTGTEFLKDLFEGKLAYTEGNAMYRNLKVVLLLSDETTSPADTAAFARFTSKTHIVVRINYINGKPNVNVKYPTPEMNLAFSGFIDQRIDPRGFWDKFDDKLGEIGDDMFVILYDALDFLAKGIGKLKVPNKVWDCCDKDYNPKYEAVFRYILSPLDILVPIIEKLFRENYGSEGCALFTTGRGVFAFNVGLWNGLVDVFEGIPTMLKLLVSTNIKPQFKVNPATGQPYRNDWGILKDSIKLHGDGFMGFVRVIGGTLRDLHDPAKPCLFYHSIGSDVFNVVAAIISGGETLAGNAAGSFARTLFVTLEKFDVVSNVIGNVGKLAGKYVVKPALVPVKNAVRMELQIIWKDVNTAGKAVMKVVNENGEYIFQFLDPNNYNIYNKFAWQTARIVEAEVKNTNNRYSKLRLGFPNIPVNAGTLVDDIARKNLRVEIVRMVTDNSGQPIVNNEGQGLVEITAEGAEPGTNGALAVVDDADRLSHGMPETGYARTNGEFTKIDEVLTQATDAAKNAELLATLNQWDNAMYRKLDDVLKDVRYPNLVNEFAADPNLLNYFKAYASRWEGKFAVKMDIMDGRITGANDFKRFIHEVIPPQANGVRATNIQDLGRVFDQQYVIEAERAFVNNDFSELPHLQQYKDQGYEIATGQVRLKTPVTPGTKVEVRPDCMFFKVDTRGRVILAEPGIWQECKIRRSSPLTENQETVIEMLINGQLNNTQIVFEVGTSRLQDIGLPKGTAVTIDVVNQISIENNRIITIPLHY